VPACGASSPPRSSTEQGRCRRLLPGPRRQVLMPSECSVSRRGPHGRTSPRLRRSCGSRGPCRPARRQPLRRRGTGSRPSRRESGQPRPGPGPGRGRTGTRAGSIGARGSPRNAAGSPAPARSRRAAPRRRPRRARDHRRAGGPRPRSGTPARHAGPGSHATSDGREPTSWPPGARAAPLPPRPWPPRPRHAGVARHHTISAIRTTLTRIVNLLETAH
jgi:hypothetical protein